MTFATDKDNMETRVNDTLSLAQGYLDALAATADVDFTPNLPPGYNYAAVPLVQFPVFSAGLRPDVTTIGNERPPEAPTFTFSSLSTIALPTDDLLLPTNNFAFYEVAYTSTLLDPLKAKLLDNLTNGGYGIETADEVALFNRARDREVDAMMSRIEDAGRAMASRGFALPPGELSIHVDRAYQDMQNKVSDVSRDITLQRNKLYVENRQFTITQVRELEQILIGFHNSVQERAFNVAKATAEFVLTYFNTLVSRYNARLAAAKITSEVQFQVLQAEAERARAYISVFDAQTRAYEANLRRLIDSAKLRVDVYNADIANNRVANDATISMAQLQQEGMKAAAAQNIKLNEVQIENARTRMNGAIARVQFLTEASKFGSEKFFAQLTALINTLNVLTVETTTA